MKTRLFLCAFVLAVGIALFVGLTSVSADPPIYWKPGGWIDYAPNGLPDFDQKQDAAWQDALFRWSYCGPVAVANSLWWFDSKFEPKPAQPPTINDNYHLITSYNPGWDDHHPSNVPPLVQDLAYYFDTDGQRTAPGTWNGTNIYDMFYGLQWYLYGWPPWGLPTWPYRYYDDYYVTLKKMPTFDWVAEEVLRSEDVILLLGFWQDQDPGLGELWVRVGGHYVTVAGVDAAAAPPQIAFSDPFLDARETGWPLGRFLNGSITPHAPIPGHGANVHNDAGNLSHDIYNVVIFPATTSPHGLWEIVGYPYADNFREQNCPPEFVVEQGTNDGSPIYIEVEYAIAMSPFYWKPGGEWVWSDLYGGIWEWWWYEDDGHSCLPDFSSGGWGYRYDGPVVIANSFWWFDSKYETEMLIPGGWPQQQPPAKVDHYDLVTAYGNYDDHSQQNIAPLVQDLAGQTNTTSQGTTTDNMVAGISTYLAQKNLLSDFYTKTMSAPTFEWVAHEVTKCEDVILLLGFWENTGTAGYERKGGHYVNAAGVHVATGSADKDLIGLSDPAMDNAVGGKGLGRVFEPENWNTGFPNPNNKGPTDISHDIYHIGSSPVSNGQWTLADYPVTSTVPNFVGLNGGGSAWGGGPLYTVVEWSVAVSPKPPLEITKTSVITEEIYFGDWITYTIRFSNVAPYTVTNLTIDEPLPSTNLVLGTSSFATSASAGVSINHVPGSYYKWTIPSLAHWQGGVISVTAQVTQATQLITETVIITNTVLITGTGLPQRDEISNYASYATSMIMHRGAAGTYLPLIMEDHTP